LIQIWKISLEKEDMVLLKIKLSLVLLKNPGFSQWKKIAEKISGENLSNNGKKIAELSPENISRFKYILIVSCDV